MDTTKFIDAVSELSETKGLSRQAIIFALEEALKKAYLRYLGGGDDAVVVCTIDEEKGEITLAQVKKVVEEVEDDYLEISVEDANAGKKKAKYKAGDDYLVVCPIEDLTKVTAIAVKNNLRAKLAEAERTMLYEILKDHIGEMMTGVVEKADEHSVTVKIDRTSIELTRKELIGDEYFRVGDPIKVYIQEVKAPEQTDGKPSRGPQVQATRSNEGFLKRLFEEEINEVYEGTVLIKAIARQAGVRSKVAVVSVNEDIDATGACIGQGGSRIQKIVSQLGNGKNKEKIDVINYHENPGLFMIEAVRPATVLGLNLYDDDMKAEVLIEDGALPVAFGKFKSNLTLAKRITGYDIEFIEKAKSEQLGLIFTSVEEWKARAEEENKEKERQAYIAKQQEEAARREAELRAKEEEERRLAEEAEKARAEEMPEVVVKPAAPEKPVPPKADVRPEEFPSSAINPAAAALAAERAARQARAEAEKADNGATAVRTTTTLEDLEKELEETKERKNKPGAKKRPRKITEEEVAPATVEPVKPAVPTVPVYTEEELAKIESEEEAAYDDTLDDIDEDYSDYDDYYDDDDGR